MAHIKKKVSATLHRIVMTAFLMTILFCPSNIEAQSVDIFGGFNTIAFYDIDGGAPYNYSRYSSSPGYFLGIGLEDLNISDLPLRLNFNIEKFAGSAGARNGGRGGGRSTNAEISKYLFSIGAFPFKINIHKNLLIEPGLLSSLLLHEKVAGTTTTSAGNIPTTVNLKDDRDKFNSLFNLGIQAYFKYLVKQSGSSGFTLFYSFYLGLTNEFIKFPKATKSMRHSIGVSYRIK